MIVEDDARLRPGLDDRFIPTGDDLEDIAKVVVGSAVVILVTSLARNLGGRQQNVIYFALAFMLFAWIVYRRKED